MSLIYFPDLPPSEWLGKEVVTVYETDIGSNSTFFTDSNGRRWMKRVRNLRKSWNLTLTEPIASNYYPITTGVYIADKKQRLNVIVDRPEGASSMSNGSVEIMVSTTIFSERENFFFFFSFLTFSLLIQHNLPTFFLTFLQCFLLRFLGENFPVILIPLLPVSIRYKCLKPFW